jgi:hypothetical protein
MERIALIILGFYDLSHLLAYYLLKDANAIAAENRLRRIINDNSL